MKLALLLSLLFASGAGAAETPPPAPPEAGIRPLAIDGARAVELVVDGAVVDWEALPPAAGRTGGFLLLVGPAEEAETPRRLLRADPATHSIETLADGLPPATDALAVVAATDGGPEIFVGGPGIVRTLGRLGALGPPRDVVAGPGIALDGVLVARGGELRVPAIGLLRRFVRGDDGWEEASSLDLPVRVERKNGVLSVSRRAQTLLETADRSLVVTEPEALGDRRLRTVLLDPSADAPEARTVEAWSSLPAPEKVETARPVLVDGRPFAVVTTFPADRLGIFDRPTIRVLPLLADRTRAGRPPSFTVESESRRWNPPRILLLDADRDGRDDLILLQPQGMGGDDLLVDVHFGLGGGGFRRLAVRVELKDAGRGRPLAGHDVDGDGLPDLLVVRKSAIDLYRGRPDARKALVEKRPRQLAVPTSNGADVALGDARFVDLDGDGRFELVTGPTTVSGRSVLRWIAVGGG